MRIPRAHIYSGSCRPLWLFGYKTLTFYGWASHLILLSLIVPYAVLYPECISTLGLASFAFARHYSRNLVWFLFLFLLRCFSSEGSLVVAMDSLQRPTTWLVGGFPIRTSPDQSVFAAPRSLSQLIASFIGSQCQGILLVLFFAWTILHLLSQILFLTWVSQIGFFSLANCNTITCLYGKTIFYYFETFVSSSSTILLS